MAKPQVENGHTRIANEILEHLMRMYLPPNQWQVLLCIIRKTYGFHKKVDWIANSQIIESTGLVKSTVSRALKALEQKKLISRNKRYLGLQKDWEKWQKVSSIANNQKLAIQQPKLADRKPKLAIQSTKVSSPEDTQKKKETTQKKLYKRKEGLPDFIDEELWHDFMDVRKGIKAVNTERAIDMLIKKLEELRRAGDDPNEVLKQSIMNSWKGVFPLKKGGQSGAHRQSSRQLPKAEDYRSPEEIYGGGNG